MSDLYRPNELLCFGRVIQVDGSTVAIQLDQGINDLTRSYQGRLYSIGQIGSVIKLLNGRRVLFASVRSLRLETDDDVQQITKSIDPKSESRTLLADLLGQGTWNGTDLKFHRGISEYPLPRQQAYLVTAEELEGLYRGAEANRGQTDERSAEIGTYSGASSARCHASIDKFFGHHAAIVGSTGSGKSCAVAALIHSVLNEAKLHPRIIILDPHGEYATAFGDKAQVFRAYSRSDQNDDHEVIKLPFWLLSSDEFRSLIIGKTEHEATAQDNIVHKALLHSRLVGANFIEPARSWVAKPIIADGSLPEDPRPLSPTLASTVNGFDRDRPISFSLDEFERHIVDEQMTVVKNGNYSSIAPSDDHGKRCRSVINKLKVLRRDQRLSFLMNPGDFSLSHVLAQFTGVIPGTSEKPIRIIDLSGTPNEIAGVLTSLIARLLMEVKIRQTNAEIDRDPVVLLCEEAHRYVPEAGEAQYREAQNAVRRIAKEGRKYGVSLVVVSQRPSELDQTVLSQCGSWIVLRLTNGFDQALIKRVLPDHLGGLTEMLSSLGRQEALFLGDAAALPARIRLLDLPIEKRPRSQDRSFSKGWCDVGLSQIDFDRIASRWRGMPTESALAMVEPRIAAGENSQQSTTFHRAAEDDPPF